MDKVEGPTAYLTFLGIEIDTTAGILRLPRDKLNQIHNLLEQWAGKKVCTRRELESLIGTLQHACKVVRPGRAFLRRMIDLLRSPQRPYHHTRLNLQLIPSRPAVVADICGGVEWHSRTTSYHPGIRGGHVGRIRTMGVWGLEPLPLVPVRVAGRGPSPPHHI